MIFSTLPVILLGASVTNAALTYKGVDWSSVAVEEKAGVSYKTANGNAQPLERILASSGVNTVRQRVWVNPAGGDYNLAYNIALAKRAKSAGLGVYVDLHYSDTWADPGHQAIPAGWPTGIDDLSWKLYNYTLDVSNQFQDVGVQPTIISIGNEITAGLLWPTGRTSSWGNVARLLHSASAAVKDSRLNPKPKIMIHLDNGWNWSTQNNWYTNVLKQGTLVSSDFDMIGISFYPFYSSSATLSALKTSLTNLANGWGKDLVVAETDWPTSCPAPKTSFPSDARSIPYSAAGQATWIKDVANVVAGVKGGVGLFYWEPAWIHNANLGSSCADNCMFSHSGQALSSMSVFEQI
ncbi:family 53 glycosyl hydrolase [Lasiosphaeria miniovina]|uniref:Arabinogalactan endo-beta-1,4-galactanase n=1 Tax=Lasiosphaeria miniovina TaxID=1954250 RepID=A0AA39ZU64_9PEZI|nr:family 53 glycosyl hydrolase [Lasiosphaeria miniovina]KAK0703620.1 family 53 glycosyl hydrolase [Lasiosphaeria miniovina]